MLAIPLPWYLAPGAIAPTAIIPAVVIPIADAIPVLLADRAS